jgi:hypothetical protein
MTNFYSMVLGALTRQEDWIATLTPEQQQQVRVKLALIEIAVKESLT